MYNLCIFLWVHILKGPLKYLKNIFFAQLTKCQEMACIIEAHLCLVFLTNQPLRRRFCANFPHHKKVAASIAH